MGVFNVLLAILKAYDSKVLSQEAKNLKPVNFEKLLFESLGLKNKKDFREVFTGQSNEGEQSLFNDKSKKSKELIPADTSVPVETSNFFNVYFSNLYSKARDKKSRVSSSSFDYTALSDFYGKKIKKNNRSSVAVKEINRLKVTSQSLNVKDKDLLREFRTVLDRVAVDEYSPLNKNQVRLNKPPLASKSSKSTDKGTDSELSKLQKKPSGLRIKVNNLSKNNSSLISENLYSKKLDLKQVKKFKKREYLVVIERKNSERLGFEKLTEGNDAWIGKELGEGGSGISAGLDSGKIRSEGGKFELKSGFVYSEFTGHHRRSIVNENYSSVREKGVNLTIEGRNFYTNGEATSTSNLSSVTDKKFFRSLELFGIFGSRRGLILKREEFETVKFLKKRSPFPPGKLPLERGAVLDRRNSPPVHLFEQPSGGLPGVVTLLSNAAANFQHGESYRFYRVLSGGENSSHLSFGHYSSDYLQVGVFSWSFNGSSEFGNFEGGADFTSKSNQVEDEKSVFHLSYADRDFKLSIFSQGKILNLNLSFLENLRLDPSVMKDIASIIENSGFIPGKITLRQKKERYAYSDKRVDGKLELKV